MNKAKKNIENGLCRCGQLPNPGYKCCPQCLERGIARYRTPEGRAAISARSKLLWKTRKAAVFNHYGDVCACCGETHHVFLTVDHIEKSANEIKKEDPTHTDGVGVYGWLIKNNFPVGFQILCFNCNMAKRWARTCPHKEILEK